MFDVITESQINAKLSYVYQKYKYYFIQQV